MAEQNIYDNQDFFDGYKELRENPFSANIIVEKPALFSLCHNLKDKKIIDLGCGYGENCKSFIEMGARHVTGIDISKKMLDVAKTENSHENIKYINMSMSDLHELKSSFDVVLSSLAFHYVKDFDKLLFDIHNILTDNGELIFSQEHPLTTALKDMSNCWSKDENGDFTHYNLSYYGNSGERSTEWIVDNVIKYHRSFSDIFNSLIKAGFAIKKVLEPIPDAETIERLPAYKNSIHKPYFLLIQARKM